MDAMTHLSHLIKVESRESCVKHCHEYTDIVVWILFLVSDIPYHASLVKKVFIGEDEYAKESTADREDLHA